MKIFEPQAWINSEKPEKRKTPVRITSSPIGNGTSDFDKIMSRVDCDIAPSYDAWLRLGFALAAEFGEAGRAYYHHLSAFNNTATSDAIDKQYSNCLKSPRAGVTIKTFYFLCKCAGIKISEK